MTLGLPPFGRVAVLGDAALVARPHCGMGVTKAAGDAVALAHALQANDDIYAALSTYEQDRLAFGHFIVGHAQRAGAYMEAQIRTPEGQAMAERYRTPDELMDETAIAPRMRSAEALH